MKDFVSGTAKWVDIGGGGGGGGGGALQVGTEEAV